MSSLRDAIVILDKQGLGAYAHGLRLMFTDLTCVMDYAKAKAIEAGDVQVEQAAYRLSVRMDDLTARAQDAGREP